MSDIGWMDKYGRMDKQMEGYAGGQVWKDKWMDRLGRMNGWMDKWMIDGQNGRMDG